MDQTELNSWLTRITLAGDQLCSMEPPGLAASVRLLIPSPGAADLVIPEWNGNEFLLPSGERPVIRTFTPLRFDRDAETLQLEIVRHDAGAVSEWVRTVREGASVAISGPGRAWEPDSAVERLVLLGDESAVPAIIQILEGTPDSVRCEVHAEARSELPASMVPTRNHIEFSWHAVEPSAAPGGALLRAAQRITDTGGNTHVWAAGEAACMQALRKHFIGHLEVPRSLATIRGYWKTAR